MKQQHTTNLHTPYEFHIYSHIHMVQRLCRVIAILFVFTYLNASPTPGVNASWCLGPRGDQLR